MVTKRPTMLYYIVSLHQTTTRPRCIAAYRSCIISFLYIKPQHLYETGKEQIVVLYRFSTSNHNKRNACENRPKLYYIVSLHQTTTGTRTHTHSLRCIISFLYIKPQRRVECCINAYSCIISFLYIKPQPDAIHDGQAARCIISFLYIKPQQAYLSGRKR